MAKFADAPPDPKVVPLRPDDIPRGESAFALLERDIPEPVKLCDPWGTEGVNIIAGRPKLGKTTLERQKMAACATGTEFLDSKFAEPHKCAFLSLEEGELLCRSKFKSAGFTEAALAGIELFFEWPRGYAGCELLDKYLSANPDVRFVCIDSLTRFRSIPDAKEPAFMVDYNAVNALHDVSKKHPGVCIDIVHHTRKVRSDDPIDDISGTYGLTAAASSCVILRYQADGVVMHIYGRLWNREETQFFLKRSANQRWQMIGAHMDLTEAQRETYDRLKARPNGYTGKELAEEMKITIPSAWQRLDELLEKGLVTKRFGRVYPK